ncbi:hypothetical protein [Ruania alba]|uniref:Uncharacterized protein n=1 Tax=Ruania alba TaxID=648782 RepID=A0A1H5MZS0_9MICO|nr:hypothetical protein [Ruania alba]SEE94814.1 hypothetical protein SAMN04488554_3794 [Ruania alba]
MTRTPILDLGAGGSRLRVETAYQGSLWHFDTTVITEAHPWSGSLETVFTDRHLDAFARALRSTELPRTATLGSDRSPEIALHLSEQQGGPSGSVAIMAEMAWTGDDPYPFLRWLIFDTPRDFGAGAAAMIDELLLQAHRQRKAARGVS